MGGVTCTVPGWTRGCRRMLGQSGWLGRGSRGPETEIGLVASGTIGVVCMGRGGALGGDSDNVRSLKALRLMKLTKMLRLGRLKRILQDRSDGDDFVIYQQAFSILATLFVIMFLAHMLACFYYFIGENSEDLGNGLRVPGWVEMETNWMVMSEAVGSNGSAVADPAATDC
eukprot:SAG22_NODE_7059_length_781_cov_0.866569_1_plen_170_part_10